MINNITNQVKLLFFTNKRFLKSINIQIMNYIKICNEYALYYTYNNNNANCLNKINSLLLESSIARSV